MKQLRKISIKELDVLSNREQSGLYGGIGLPPVTKVPTLPPITIGPLCSLSPTPPLFSISPPGAGWEPVSIV